MARPTLENQPSLMSVQQGSHSASTSLFRRLVSPPTHFAPRVYIQLYYAQIFDGTVPLEIKIDLKEFPANSDRSLEYYFVCTNLAMRDAV